MWRRVDASCVVWRRMQVGFKCEWAVTWRGSWSWDGRFFQRWRGYGCWIRRQGGFEVAWRSDGDGNDKTVKW